MTIYYLYFVAPNGRFAARENIEAPDDDSAIALASRWSDGRAMELWDGPRRVHVFPSKPSG